MKKLKDRILKDNQMVQMTLKEFIEHFQQVLNYPASTLIATRNATRYNNRAMICSTLASL